MQSKITPITQVKRSETVPLADSALSSDWCLVLPRYAMTQAISAVRGLIATKFILSREKDAPGIGRARHVVCVDCRAPQFDLRCLHHYAGCAVGDAQEWIGHLENLLGRSPSTLGDCSPEGLRS